MLEEFRRIILFKLLIVASFPVLIYAQEPTIQWQFAFGGSDEDKSYSIVQTRDGGYASVGYTLSNNGNVSGNHGYYDVWVIKVDSNGTLMWQKCFGGSDVDFGYFIDTTFDGGLIIAAATTSNDGDVIGNHSYSGHFDYWLIKLDSIGVLKWQKCFGGSFTELPFEVHQTIDFGYVMVGQANSDDYDVTGQHACNGCTEDYWVVKTDSSGNLQWEKSLGGTNYDYGQSIRQTLDEGFVVSGTTQSDDGNVSNPIYVPDIWVVKLDALGNILWDKCFGGGNTDDGFGIVLTKGNCIVISGTVQSFDTNITDNHGGSDRWLVKLDSLGNKIWQKCYGGSYSETAQSLNYENDGGFICGGITASNDYDVSGNHGSLDYWITKIDSSGNLKWQKCLGGSGLDWGYSASQTIDQGYIVTGTSNSNDGDVTGNHGATDFWIVKLAPLPDRIETNLNLIYDFMEYPNPTSEEIDVTFFSNGNEKIELELIDITGHILLQDAFSATNGLNKHHFFTGDLSGGIYFVRLQADGGAVTKKVVIQ